MESIDIYEMLSKNAHEFMEIVMLRVEIFFLFKKKKMHLYIWLFLVGNYLFSIALHEH